MPTGDFNIFWLFLAFLSRNRSTKTDVGKDGEWGWGGGGVGIKMLIFIFRKFRYIGNPDKRAPAAIGIFDIKQKDFLWGEGGGEIEPIEAEGCRELALVGMHCLAAGYCQFQLLVYSSSCTKLPHH